MGTKQNPGKFDCYANADEDEPMFVLLARDPQAPKLVELWAQERLLWGEDHTKLQEALRCANDMRSWHVRNEMAQAQKRSGEKAEEIARGIADFLQEEKDAESKSKIAPTENIEDMGREPVCECGHYQFFHRSHGAWDCGRPGCHCLVFEVSK